MADEKAKPVKPRKCKARQRPGPLKQKKQEIQGRKRAAPDPGDHLRQLALLRDQAAANGNFAAAVAAEIRRAEISGIIRAKPSTKNVIAAPPEAGDGWCNVQTEGLIRKAERG